MRRSAHQQHHICTQPDDPARGRATQDADDASARDAGTNLEAKGPQVGESYRELLARARGREADLYLEIAALPIARVARRLGFANDGALRNSLRRAGAPSPLALRRFIRSDGRP